MRHTSAVVLLALALSSAPPVLGNRHKHSKHSDNLRGLHHSGASRQLSEQSDAGAKRLVKRGSFNGKATYYAPGLGACGSTSSGGDFVVALNEAQYGDMGAVSSWCFKTITISYGGRSTQATIVDACPGCPYGGLDMSPALFDYFADKSVGVFYMTWSSGGSSSPKPTTTTTTTTTWRAPTSTWQQPTTTTTTWRSPTPTTPWVQSSSSLYGSISSIAAGMSNGLNSTSSNSTSPNVLNNSTVASSSPISSADDAAPTLGTATSTQAGGNLDQLSQLVLAVGGLLGNAAHNAALAASS